jgi:hypothetical protein
MAAEFGSCCESLKDAMKSDEFEPLIAVDNGVLYMSVGLLEAGGDEADTVDHPMFFCPFCGKGVQTEAEVEARSARRRLKAKGT